MYRDLGALETRVVKEETAAAEAAAQLVPQTKVHPFRNALIDLALQAGCKVRQVEAGTRSVHDFDKSARIRAAIADGQNGALPFRTPYALAIQPVHLTLVGGLGNLESFLAKLSQTNGLVHTQRITLKPDRGDPALVELEMMIEVFDLLPAGASGN